MINESCAIYGTRKRKFTLSRELFNVLDAYGSDDDTPAPNSQKYLLDTDLTMKGLNAIMAIFL